MYDFPKNVTSKQIETRIEDAVSTAIIMRMSSSDLHARLDEHVLNGLRRRYANGRLKFPQDLLHFARGYIAAKINQIYRYHLEFCYEVDGVLYSTHKESKRPTTEQFYVRGEGHVLAAAQGHHYWKEGNNKVWF